jgi:hypothetical protein
MAFRDGNLTQGASGEKAILLPLGIAVYTFFVTWSKVTRNRSTFSTDDAIFKTLYLALNQFAIEFGKERVPF